MTEIVYFNCSSNWRSHEVLHVADRCVSMYVYPLLKASDLIEGHVIGMYVEVDG